VFTFDDCVCSDPFENTEQLDISTL
jgi:hypothetical protein